MHLRRVMTTWMLVLFALACLAPAVAVADGPSAGDQQYTDPLGASNGSGSKTSSGSHTTSTSSGSSATPSSSSSSGASQSASPPASSSGTSAAPVATVAASSTTTSTTGALPRTGLDLWSGAGIGVVLLGAGMTLRRRVRPT